MGIKKYLANKLVLLVVVGFVAMGFGFSGVARGGVPTVNYYKCTGRVGGEYNYGRAPQACNANAFGNDKYVMSTFKSLIYNDTAASSERSRYVAEMNAVIKEAATYYLKKRKPEVSATELSWWVFAIQATASHESYWSHYRKGPDSRLKMMRGDYGHGHGMMQIDDRAHFPAVNSGIAWNLTSNLTYGMDVFYRQWQRAPSQYCVGSPTNYEARVRAAWAAYNGGGGRLCRWTNSADRWSENDKNFYYHFRNRQWEKYIMDPNKKASIDVPCLIEKKENCPQRGAPPRTPTLKAGVLYKGPSEKYCVIQKGKAFCVSEARDAICLNQLSSYASPEAAAVSAAALAAYAPTTLDRHSLCKTYESTLLPVGMNIETQRNLNFRVSPGGGLIRVIPKGEVFTILDFELRHAPENERYYKIRYQDTEGYIFGGAKTDYDTWVVPETGRNLPASLARVGESVKVVNKVGINHRAAPGGALLALIPPGTQLQVFEVFIEGSNNKAYYRVNYKGQTGYIYTGFLQPTDTTGEWCEVLR